MAVFIAIVLATSIVAAAPTVPSTAGETVESSATNTTTGAITVQTSTTFDVSNLDAPSEALVSDTIEVNATVTNTGDVNGSTEVEYVFNGTVVQNQSVTLDAGNSTTVNFTASTAGIDEGTYTHGVRAGNNSSTAQITVREFVEVVGADASGFTTIQTFVNVNSSAGRNGNLSAENFTVYEDGVEQTVDSAQFTQNESKTKLDIVYVFDRSGSMGDEIDDLRSQMKNVSQDLNESGRDVRFALVTFSDDYGRYDQNLTRNVTELEIALDKVSAGGGTERAYDAIDRALQLRFRGDAQKVVVTITDEDVDRSHDSKNISQVSTALQQKGVNFVGISPPTSETRSGNPELSIRELANRSGGVWYDIEGADFTEIIDDITGRLSTTWIVTYDTTNQVQGESVRTVDVTVEDPSGARDTGQGGYIPPQVDITDVDTSGFPTINATVKVNTTEGNNGNLTVSDFNISEDGSEQSIQSLRFDSQNKTYVIEYTTPDTAENGTVRDIEVTVSLSGGARAVVTTDYQAPGTRSNQLPNVTFTASPTDPATGETVTFDASNSTDPDGSIVSYEWDLDGDGNYDDATGDTVTTSYSSDGNRQVGLRVEDDGGATNTTTRVVSVGDVQTITATRGAGPGPGPVLVVLSVATLLGLLGLRNRE